MRKTNAGTDSSIRLHRRFLDDSALLKTLSCSQAVAERTLSSRNEFGGRKPVAVRTDGTAVSDENKSGLKSQGTTAKGR